MIKFTPLRLKRGSLFLAFLSTIILLNISCKKQLLTGSDEVVDPKALQRNIAYAKGPKIKNINLNEFKKQVNIESLGTLTTSFREYNPNKGKLMSVSTSETFKGFNIQTDSINVIETETNISYVFPVKLSSPRAISFQNLTIQKNKSSGATIAFVSTYSPTRKWIDDWKRGKSSKFDGQVAFTYLNLTGDPLPLPIATSTKSSTSRSNKIMLGDAVVCETVILYYVAEYTCASNQHWPGDNRCTLLGDQRAGYEISYIEYDPCGGSSGGSGGSGGSTGGGDNGGGSGGGSGGGGIYYPPGGGGGVPPTEPGGGDGGGSGSGGNGGGTGGGTGPGTIPTPPGDYDPCIGTDPGMGGLNVVNGATGAKLMISQPVDCDPSVPPIITPEPSDPDYSYDPLTSISTPSRYSGLLHPETGEWLTYGQFEDYFEANPDIAEGVVAMDFPTPILTYPTWIASTSQEIMQEASYLKILHPNWSNARIGATATWNVLSGTMHFALDLVGMVPVIGEAADIVNGAIYYMEGDRINAALSVASAVPVYGWVSTGGKWVRTVGKLAPKALTEAAGRVGYVAIKNAKGAVRFVKVAISSFSHGAITALKAVKPADNTLTNLSRTMLDQLSLRIRPVAQNLKSKVDDIVLHGDAAGTKTEQLCDEMFATNGFVKHDAKIGSNNGLDGVYIKKDASGNVQEIIINEAKQVGSAGNIKLNGSTPNKGPQMSDEWIQQTLNEMENTQNMQQLANTIRQNYSKVKRTVTAVDKSTGEIVILKLGIY